MGENFAEGSPDVADNKRDPEAGPTDPHGGADAGGFGCMAITRTALRGAEFALSLISFSLVAASNNVAFSGVFVTITVQTLSASGVAFLLAMGVIACVYALAAAVLLVVAILRPESELTYKLPRPLLITDFVILLLLFAASCSAASYTTSCGGSSSCSLVQGGSAMGLFASFCFMADFWLTLIPVFVEI